VALPVTTGLPLFPSPNHQHLWLGAGFGASAPRRDCVLRPPVHPARPSKRKRTDTAGGLGGLPAPATAARPRRPHPRIQSILGSDPSRPRPPAARPIYTRAFPAAAMRAPRPRLDSPPAGIMAGGRAGPSSSICRRRARAAAAILFRVRAPGGPLPPRLSEGVCGLPRLGCGYT
jgi:hypothetical protein